MIKFLLDLLLAGLTLASISIRKAYANVPVKELKRRANQGDELAKALHMAVAYGASLDLLLWGVIALATAGFCVALTLSIPTWLAVLGCAGLLWFGFAWLSESPVSGVSQKLTKFLSPYIAWFLSKTYPILNRLGGFIANHKRISVHSGLYQKDDLIELLERQQQQPDNRLTAAELAVVKGALSYSDQIIRDVMTPKRVIKTVKQNDSVGPLLMDELHKSGFSRFPVTGDKPDHIVGTLYIKDLVQAKASGQVKDLMKKQVFYVNEEKPLQHALQAFLKTKHHLFIVVNGFEEIVGIITIEDVLEQILGKQIVDEFDRYADLRAVAALEAKKDAASHKHAPEGEALDKATA